MLKPHYKLFKMWLNVYPTKGFTRVHAGGMYSTRYQADMVAKEHRITCILVYVPMPSRRKDMIAKRKVNNTRTSF